MQLTAAKIQWVLIVLISVGLTLWACKRPWDSQYTTGVNNAMNDLPATRRVDTLRSWGSGAPRIMVQVPQDLRLSDEKGPDFDVFRYATSDATSKWFGATMGFYVGHAPNEFSRHVSNGTIVSKWSGNRFAWKSWQDVVDGRIKSHCESIVQNLFRDVPGTVDAGGVRQLNVHVFIVANDEAALHDLVECAETLGLDVDY